MKIKVLTSQHEDMFFRVVIQAVDPLSKEHLDLVSNPIRVVSKPGQLLKRRKVKAKKTTPQEQYNNNNNSAIPSNSLVSSLLAQATANGTLSNTTGSSPVHSPISTPSYSPQCCNQEQQQNKRPLDVPAHDDVNLAHTMSRLEEQQLLLQQIKRQYSPHHQHQQQYPPLHSSSSDEFEYLFQKLMDSYNNLPMEDRTYKIRKVLGSSSPFAVQNISQFADIISSEINPQLPIQQMQQQQQLNMNNTNNQHHLHHQQPQHLQNNHQLVRSLPNQSCCDQDAPSFHSLGPAKSEFDGLDPVYPDLFNVGDIFGNSDYTLQVPLEMY